MVYLALPFVFGPLRSVGVGNRILIGTLVGIGFHLLNQVFGYAGVVFGLNPVFVSFLPVTVAFAAGYLMLRRVF
jgi:lipopolysaccharide export system permease protein